MPWSKRGSRVMAMADDKKEENGDQDEQNDNSYG